ncbi:MAG: potassium transporter Trk [Acidimicrobiales bacterium]
MLDIVYVAVTIGFFALMGLLARGCERLIHAEADETAETRR